MAAEKTADIGSRGAAVTRSYKSSNELIALSKLTLTHEIARLLISEQIYRSITIINNHPYHHE